MDLIKFQPTGGGTSGDGTVSLNCGGHRAVSASWMSSVVSEIPSRDVSSSSGAADTASPGVVASVPLGAVTKVAVDGSTVWTSVPGLLMSTWPVGIMPVVVALVRFRVFRGGELDTSANPVSAKVPEGLFSL